MEKVGWMLAGVVALLAVKYLVFGLNQWDAILHPGRIEPASTPKIFLTGVFG